jgi:hypothetical protein
MADKWVEMDRDPILTREVWIPLLLVYVDMIDLAREMLEELYPVESR